jgi:cation diffusion facilitator family transporter
VHDVEAAAGREAGKQGREMMRSERGALVLSTVAALVIGLVALAAAALSNSHAILLDGLFNVAYVAAALMTLRVATLLTRPDDDRFPFGYIYFEPLINTAKGLLILGVSLFALFEAGRAFLAGGRPLELGPALGYSAFATVACTTVWLILRRAPCRAASPLVEADVGNWLVNTVISGGVLAGFLVALALEAAGMGREAGFVDPALVTVVVLVSLVVPIRMAGRGIAALLNRAPPEAVTGPIRAAVEEALARLPTRAVYVRTVQPGRATYVTVHALVAEAGEGLDLREADRLRRAVVAALVPRHAPVVVDVVFTAVEDFAAPTTGFVVLPQG